MACSAAATFGLANGGHSVVEGWGTVVLTVSRTGDTVTESSVEYYTTNQTAVSGKDYQSVSGVLTFLPGEVSHEIRIPILNDAIPEESEAFLVRLRNPIGAVTLKSSTASVTILDDDFGIEVEFDSYTVAEDANVLFVTVIRAPDEDFPTSVDFTTRGGSAVAGKDYVETAGTLHFNANEKRKRVRIPILNDGLKEPDKSFTFRISHPTVPSVLGGLTSAAIIVQDNDPGTSFSAPTYSVWEGSGSAVVTVIRGNDGSLSPFSVDYATSDNTATAGVDYSPRTGTLHFAQGQISQTVSIEILNGTNRESAETFRVRLLNPSDGMSLGTRNAATVTIADNDSGLRFEKVAYSAWRTSGEVSISVLRGGDGNSGEVSVDFSTVDGTARAGRDFTATTGTLRFDSNITVRSFSVPLNPTSASGQTRTFALRLSPASGTPIALPSASVTILDLRTAGGEWSVLSPASSPVLAAGDCRDWSALAVRIMTGTDPVSEYVRSRLSLAVHSELATEDPLISDPWRIKALLIQEFRSIVLGASIYEPVRFASIPLRRETRHWLEFQRNESRLNRLLIEDAFPDLIQPGLSAVSPEITPNSEGNPTIQVDWLGDGILQRADHVDGPWETLTNQISPVRRESSSPTGFFRLSHPRPVGLYVPSTYDGTTPLPLVIFLHGYGYDGAWYQEYLRMAPLAEQKSFLYCFPDGVYNSSGSRFWDATDTCCAGRDKPSEDAGYLRGVIEEIQRTHSVDRKRISLVGHSNGGFMSYRMACEHSDLVSAICSISGGTYGDPGLCVPAEPVNILQVHGLADEVVSYGAGLRSVAVWRRYNGCGEAISDPSPTLDLGLEIPGLDTTVTRFAACPPTGEVEVWLIDGAPHFPTFYSGSKATEFTGRMVDWLLAHGKK